MPGTGTAAPFCFMRSVGFCQKKGVVGCWFLVAGCWLLVAGCWLLLNFHVLAFS